MTTLQLPILENPHFEAQFNHELRRLTIDTLQINIGKLCNLACNHCHVESSPAATAPADNMSAQTAQKLLYWALSQKDIRTVDFTGGSPEMNPNYQPMVRAFHQAKWRIITRCNPTIIQFNGHSKKTTVDYSWVPQFYADHQIEVVASLPCYLENNVKKQRGSHAFSDSIQGLLKLNQVGYGSDPNLKLNLVYNPVGPNLPPNQHRLEAEYKEHLHDNYGLTFNDLYTITNIPIKRWRHELERDHQLEPYMTRLINSFNTHTLENLMCRHQINVGPDGRVYDCDFNQALELRPPGIEDRYIWELTAADLLDRPIHTADHCYACTAGPGSSCTGSLTEKINPQPACPAN